MRIKVKSYRRLFSQSPFESDLDSCVEAVIEYKPNWFERLFLGETPKERTLIRIGFRWMDAATGETIINNARRFVKDPLASKQKLYHTLKDAEANEEAARETERNLQRIQRIKAKYKELEDQNGDD